MTLLGVGIFYFLSLAGTLVGVLLVPGLYVIFQRFGDWYERRI